MTYLPKQLIHTHLETPLGLMMAIASDSHLYLLEFFDRTRFATQIARLRKKTHSTIVEGHTVIHHTIQQELHAYFNRQLKVFQTPISPLGSTFQIQVWQALCGIPFGETRSYLEIAKTLGRPTSFRAVAQANSTNPLAIIIPCHRVINASGKIGGYAGGISRKQSLLQTEGLNLR